MEREEARKQLVARWRKEVDVLQAQAKLIESEEDASAFAEIYITAIDGLQDTIRRSYDLYRDARPRK